MSQITAQYNNPDIEAYRLGLLSDSQSMIRNNIFGRQVQGLRGQINPETGAAYTDAEIAVALSTKQIGVEGEDGYVAPVNYEEGYISSISPDSVFNPPDYQVAGLTQNELDAIRMAQEGIGSYQSYIDDADSLLGRGSAAIDSGLAGAQQGTMNALQGMRTAGSAGYNYADAASAGGNSVLNQLRLNQAQAQGPMDNAIAQGQQGFQDSTYGARSGTGTAMDAMYGASNFGMGAARSGISQLMGSSGQFNPASISSFNNPYEADVVQASLADLERVADRRRIAEEQRVGAEAANIGAFGTSGYERAIDRSIDPIQEDLDRNTASTIAQLRSQGYETSAQRAMSSFENARNRQIQAAQTTGQLGQSGAQTVSSAAQAGGQLGLSTEQLAAQNADAAARLGMSGAEFKSANAMSLAQTGMSVEQLAAQTGMNAATLAGQLAQQSGQLSQGMGSLGLNAAGAYGTLGIQTAGLGELEQSLYNNDISTLLSTGGIQRTNEQAALDALKMTNDQYYRLPYQELGFLSDVYAGVPTSASTVSSGVSNSASPFMQAATLGIGGLSAYAGAQKAGIL